MEFLEGDQITHYRCNCPYARKNEGTEIAWGENNGGQCDAPADLTDGIAVSAGGAQSLALKKDGTIVSWGPMEKLRLTGGKDLRSGSIRCSAEL